MIHELSFPQQLLAHSAAVCRTHSDTTTELQASGHTAAIISTINAAHAMRHTELLRLTSINTQSCGASHFGTREEKRLELGILARKSDVLFLQETHGHAVPLNSDWLIIDNVYRNSHVKRQCRGVAIAIRRALLHDEPDVQLLWSIPARAIAVSVRMISGDQVALASLYFPNSVPDQLLFLQALDWSILSKCIWACDSNLIRREAEQGESADGAAPKPFVLTASASLLTYDLNQHNMTDIWQLCYDEGAEKIPYTHKAVGVGRANCIDRIIIPAVLSEYYGSASTTPTTTSDHDAVNVVLTNTPNRSTRPLRPAAARADLLTADEWQEIADLLENSEEDPLRPRARDRLDDITQLIKQFCDKRRKELQLEDDTDENNFQRQIIALQRRISRVRKRATLANRSLTAREARITARTQQSITKLYRRRIDVERCADVAFDRRSATDVRQIWRTQRQQHRPNRTPRIGAVIDDDGTEHTDDDHIEQAFVEHFRLAASPVRPDETTINAAVHMVLDATPAYPGLLAHIAPEIGTADLHKAILECNSDPANAAGPDCINYDLWRRLRAILRSRQHARNEVCEEHDDALMRLWATVWQERDVHQLPDAWLQSNVVLIYKGGDRRRPAQYRPISLMSCAFKTITRALLGKLKAVLPMIINEEQHAFIPGREGIDAVATVVDACAAAREGGLDHRSEALLVFILDFVKAYDTICRDYITHILNRLGFSTEFCRAVRTHVLNDDATATLVLNGRLSRRFRTTHGFRQGDALSTVLYILAVSPLFELLRRQGVRGYEIPKQLTDGTDQRISGVAFSDDTAIFLTSDAEVTALGCALDIFAKASGQVASPTKSVGLSIADYNDSLNPWYWPRVAKLVDTRRVPFVTLLGFPLCSSTMYPDAKMIAETARTATELAISKWRGGLRLSLSERAIVFSVACRAKLCYLARLVPIPDSLCHLIDRAGAAFIDPFSTDSKPLPDALIFGDATCGGLTNNGIGTTRARSTALLARRTVQFANEPSGSWRLRRTGFAWRLARYQLHRITGCIPTMASAMRSEDLFDGEGALVDPNLCSAAWALCAAHDLQLRAWTDRPLIYDEGLTRKVDRLLGHIRPRPETAFQLSCNRTIHLFGAKAWVDDRSDTYGGPLELPSRSKPDSDRRPLTVAQRWQLETGSSAMLRSIDWLRRHSTVLDVAHRALSGQWSDRDIELITRSFTDQTVAVFPIRLSGGPCSPTNWQQEGGRVGIARSIGRGAGGGLEVHVAFFEPAIPIEFGDDNGSRVCDAHTGPTAAVDARSVLRVRLLANKSIILLSDGDEQPDRLVCPVLDQRRQIAIARETMEEWCRDERRPRRGAALNATKLMTFESMERSSPIVQPDDLIRVDKLTTRMLARRAAGVDAILNDKWVDCDRSASWSRFTPWCDLRNTDLGLSLLDRDFVRRLMSDRFHRFPRGWERCPICNADADVEARHLIMKCRGALRVRDELLAQLAAAGDEALTSCRAFGNAWLWQLRPTKSKKNIGPNVFQKRLRAIRLAIAAQSAWRRAVFDRLKPDQHGVMPRWFDDNADETQFIDDVVDHIWDIF